MTRTTMFAAAGLALGLAVSQAQAGVIDFTAQTGASTATGLAVTSNGIKSTFTSPSGVFNVQAPGLFTLLSGNVLTNNDGAVPSTLVITFSKAISALSLDFALADLFASGSDTLNYVAGSITGSAAAVSPGPVTFAEGVLNYRGGPITSISLSSAYTFSIDNVFTSVPEPATMAVLGMGVLGLVAARRRRD